jgi:hypothetical protein
MSGLIIPTQTNWHDIYLRHKIILKENQISRPRIRKMRLCAIETNLQSSNLARKKWKVINVGSKSWEDVHNVCYYIVVPPDWKKHKNHYPHYPVSVRIWSGDLSDKTSQFNAYETICKCRIIQTAETLQTSHSVNNGLLIIRRTIAIFSFHSNVWAYGKELVTVNSKTF